MIDPSLAGELLESLDDQIAIVDVRGDIVYVNQAWVRFGAENGLAACVDDWLGSNYLRACGKSLEHGDPLAGEAMAGISDVLNRRRDAFYHEYPCDGPGQPRWFMMRVVPLRGHADALFAISHINITQRKLAELRIESLSLSDPLTGLANRRHFDHFLSDEWSRAMRATMPVSLLMLDLDHFKDYNDRLGHLAGDDCLRRCAAILRRFARRPSDLAARYGGEEFALILGSTDRRGAAIEAESIREEISAECLADSRCARITASIGVATVVPTMGLAESSLIDSADKALYHAKHAGRNRVECI